MKEALPSTDDLDPGGDATVPTSYPTAIAPWTAPFHLGWRTG
jgi:hypothetical protein